MTTIRNYFGMDEVIHMMLKDKSYSEHPVYKLANPDLVVGVECEIEGWNVADELRHIGFHFETDGSLRNNGMEAITKPTKSKYVPALLEGLYKHFNITENNYSQRCSTHVHVNCQDLELEQVKLLALLYQVLERPIFGFIGHDRQDNIFCVPWSQCNLSVDFAHKFIYDPNYTVRSWQKYTALNLLPLRDRGTVEFRHLEGTCDLERITAWLNIIGMMHRYASEHDYDEFKATILDMNSISNYGAFIESVLGEHSVHLTSLPTYQQDIALGVVDCKLCMINEKGKTETKKKVEARALNTEEVLAAFERRFGVNPAGLGRDVAPQDPEPPRPPAPVNMHELWFNLAEEAVAEARLDPELPI